MTPTTEPRRQARGLRRMEEILDAAEALGAETGIEALTTSAVAERAGISPGSLYQFFDNKEAIVAALVARHALLLDELEVDLGDPRLGDLEPAEVAELVVGPLVEHHRTHPGLRSLMALQTNPQLAGLVEPLHRRLCDDVEVLIGHRAPTRGAAERYAAAQVTIQIFGSLLPMILDTPGRDRALLARELESALAAYWSTL